MAEQLWVDSRKGTKKNTRDTYMIIADPKVFRTCRVRKKKQKEQQEWFILRMVNQDHDGLK
jgi:hypothetical protein